MVAEAEKLVTGEEGVVMRLEAMAEEAMVVVLMMAAEVEEPALKEVAGVVGVALQVQMKEVVAEVVVVEMEEAEAEGHNLEEEVVVVYLGQTLADLELGASIELRNAQTGDLA